MFLAQPVGCLLPAALLSLGGGRAAAASSFPSACHVRAALRASLPRALPGPTWACGGAGPYHPELPVGQRRGWQAAEGCLPCTATLTFREDLDSGKPPQGGLELPLGPGGHACPLQVEKASQTEGSGTWKTVEVILGPAKAKHHSLAPLPLGLPTHWEPPPLGCSSPQQGPVFFVNLSACTSLASCCECAFAEDRDLLAHLHVHPPPMASADTRPDPWPAN